MDHIQTSEWFWSIIKKADRNKEKLKEILSSFTKEEVIRFQENFMEVSVELQDKPYTDYMEESEDGVEDIANWVVSNGLDLYLSVTENPKKIPYSVNEFTDQILYGIADEICIEKYGESTGIY
ncbi:MAG: ferredoxin [Sphingobacterium sp.]|jgi:hypothetical protein|nr:DUF4240 domain-containing protein [uncultured Sphingobacterium sp.]MDF2477099.1 ferredoxin [Sphingobacterium sp.]